MTGLPPEDETTERGLLRRLWARLVETPEEARDPRRVQSEEGFGWQIEENEPPASGDDAEKAPDTAAPAAAPDGVPRDQGDARPEASPPPELPAGFSDAPMPGGGTTPQAPPQPDTQPAVPLTPTNAPRPSSQTPLRRNPNRQITPRARPDLR